MLLSTKTISNTIGTLYRSIKVLVYGDSDARTAAQAAPFGIDSSPPKDFIAIYGETDVRGQKVIIGYLNRNLCAADGETRLYSLKGDGTLSQDIWLKSDGTMEIGGNGDFMTKFNNTKAVVDEIQSDIASLKSAFNSWIVIPSDGGAALKTSSASWAGTPLTEDIDSSKATNIKTS